MNRPEDAAGRRGRLRERFLRGGGDALLDHELLELLLYQAVGRRDVKPIARELIDTFGGFSQAIAAEPERLKEVGGVGEAAVAALKAVEAAMHRALYKRIEKRPALANWQAILDYCRALLQDRGTERFHVVYLNRKNEVLRDERQTEGTIDRAPVYPREVVRRALELKATAVILVHNHPSGDPTPSRQDVLVTQQVIEAGRAVGVEVRDHIVVARDGHASLRDMQLI